MSAFQKGCNFRRCVELVLVTIDDHSELSREQQAETQSILFELGFDGGKHGSFSGHLSAVVGVDVDLRPLVVQGTPFTR